MCPGLVGQSPRFGPLGGQAQRRAGRDGDGDGAETPRGAGPELHHQGGETQLHREPGKTRGCFLPNCL